MTIKKIKKSVENHKQRMEIMHKVVSSNMNYSYPEKEIYEAILELNDKIEALESKMQEYVHGAIKNQ